jgi:adenosine deaminase
VLLGVHHAVAESPWRALRAAGVGVAIGADDPLVFRAGLLENYAALEATDTELADLARCSVLASTAPPDVQQRLLAGITSWVGPA